jgi:hypothetical protein
VTTFSAGAKKCLHSNQGRHEVTVGNFTGAVRTGDLLLVGMCSEGQGDAARVVEVDVGSWG